MVAQLTICLVNWAALRGSGELEATVCFNESHKEWDQAVAGVHPSTGPSPPKQLGCAPWSACVLRTIPNGAEIKFIFDHLTRHLATGQPAHKWVLEKAKEWTQLDRHPPVQLLQAWSVLLCKITCYLQWVPDPSSQQFIASDEPMYSNFCVDPISNSYKRCKKSAGMLITHWAQIMLRESPRLLPRERG